MFRFIHDEARVYGGLIVLFALSRGLYYRAGVRFDSDTIYYFAQLLDPVLLQTRLVESLWYLHSQPPIFNGLTGLVLKAAPGFHATLLWILFMVIGCCTMLLLYATLRRMGSSASWAALAAAAFCCAPAFVLYENWYFYPQLVLAVSIGIGYALLRSGGEPSRWMAAAFWLIAILVGLRSVYHPLYAVLAMGTAALVSGRARWRAVTRLAALPLLLVGALLLKNWLLFDLPATSSWGGNSLHRVAVAGIDRSELERLVAQGIITPVALAWQFSPGDRIAEMLALDPRQTGVPALDQTYKAPLNEHTRINPANYNHWAYAAASRTYTRDALVLISRYPRAYLATVVYNARRFLDPVTHDGFLRPNRERIMPLVDAANRIERFAHVFVGLAILFAVMALLRRRTLRSDRLFVLYLVGTIAWATLIGILFETGENNRFRYHLTGPHLLLVAHTLVSIVGYSRRGSDRRTVEPKEPGSRTVPNEFGIGSLR